MLGCRGPARVILLACAWLGAGCPDGSLPEDRVEARLALARGLARLDEDEPQRAIEELERAARLDPGLVEAHYLLGACHLAAPSDLGQAELHLEQALQLDPTCAEALSDLADVRRRQGRLEEARGMLEASIRLAPSDAASRLLLAKVLEALGRLDAAERSLAQAAELAPLPSVRFELAMLELRRGEIARAVTTLEEVVRADPAHAGARYQLSRLYRSMGRTADADREAWIHELLNVLSGADRPAAEATLRERASTAKELLALTPRSYRILLLLGDLHARLGEVGEAEACYRRALSTREDLPEAHLRLMQLYQSTGREEDAERHRLLVGQLRKPWRLRRTERLLDDASSLEGR